MAEHNDFGKLAEELAVNFLKQNHYQILARNWYWQKAEIDIIAKKDNIIHIVEVKARTSDDFITPEEAVNRKKRKLLIMAANEFVQNLDEEVEVQFDIISILSENGKFTLEYIDDAFESID
ncbi:YraN family protein [Elizabethkingia ursingii]|uniref:UPF0102 protein BAY32_01995 n=1 Tax=Elizabethkingia ursingii TaxID=1756150 RepID=A0AAJ3TPM2_9FLAO|nr:YraN family protein [Elizabethkingia ursingii]AQX08828.1 hypothetical protein BBD34_09320 [Elizabethkingia ursingii]KUY31396.1 hypothetical protein ATB96_10935 [Elizabethkingia ursingii]MCL1663854.1 YraN family protein [Elizabethkingia ursingii]MCL1673159.1 YraN family protein [Elizabethkingia ursingii]OPB77706.1 hypothetical protein BAY32_01995 [Elizabethkingia ursingii]